MIFPFLIILSIFFLVQFPRLNFNWIVLPPQSLNFKKKYFGKKQKKNILPNPEINHLVNEKRFLFKNS